MATKRKTELSPDAAIAKIQAAAKRVPAKQGILGGEISVPTKEDEAAFARSDKARHRELDFNLRNEEFEQLVGLYSLRKEEFKSLRKMVNHWLIVVMVILVTHALLGHPGRIHIWSYEGIFKLSDPVIIALITTTTVAVIGLFAIAAKWLFPAPDGVRRNASIPKKLE